MTQPSPSDSTPPPQPATYPRAWRRPRFWPTRPLAVWLGSREWLPRHLATVVRLDLFLRRISGGRLGVLSFAGLPELYLSVPGRKSGVLRTTPLLCVPLQGMWLVAGSYFGGHQMPAWVANLRSADTATVQYEGRSTTVVARELSGEERDRRYAQMTEVWPNFALYEQRTERTIPVFELTPA